MLRSATSKGVRLPIEALYQIARSTIVQMFQFLLIIQQLTGDRFRICVSAAASFRNGFDAADRDTARLAQGC
jgi:hypothetical protein